MDWPIYPAATDAGSSSLDGASVGSGSSEESEDGADGESVLLESLLSVLSLLLSAEEDVESVLLESVPSVESVLLSLESLSSLSSSMPSLAFTSFSVETSLVLPLARYVAYGIPSSPSPSMQKLS